MRDPELDRLIEDIKVDAYGDEGFEAFACHFNDEIGLPLSGRVIGEEIDVVDVFFDGDDRRGLTARCRRNNATYEVSLLDVSFPDGSAESLALSAYRQWLGLDPQPQSNPKRR